MIISNKPMNIVINQRTMVEDIYTQDYPFKRTKKSGFDGIETTGSLNGQIVKYFSKYNSYGWRCDEFIKEHNGKAHILFAGCSEALGEGAVVEDSWPHMLYTMLSKDLDTSGFFCLGVAGMGWIDIFSVIDQYIEEFGSPDYIFLNLPNSQRYLSYIENHLDFGLEKRGVYRYSVTDKKEKFINGSTDIIAETNFLPSDISQISLDIYIRLFEKFCEIKGINLFWGSWDNRVESINSRVTNKSKNLVQLFASGPDLYRIKNINKDLEFSKPDGHQGTAFHYVWSEKLYNAYRERKNDK
jgi:hypothetical protein